MGEGSGPIGSNRGSARELPPLVALVALVACHVDGLAASGKLLLRILRVQRHDLLGLIFAKHGAQCDHETRFRFRLKSFVEGLDLAVQIVPGGAQAAPGCGLGLGLRLRLQVGLGLGLGRWLSQNGTWRAYEVRLG